METPDDEEKLLRSAALQNAQSILLARQRAEEELQRAKAALEQKIQELAHEREWFHTTLSSIGDAVIAADTEGNVTFLNPAAEKLTGWKSGEATGQPMARIFHIINEETRAAAVNPVDRVLQEGIAIELANHTALVSKDGMEISIEDSAAPIKDASGKISGAVMVFHDVTQRRRAREAQLRLAAIVENSDDGIVGKTLNGIITSWNNGAQRIFGYAAEEMIGQSIKKIIPTERHAEEDFILSQLRRGERVEHYETVRLTKDGRRIHVSLTSSPIRDDTGRIIGASKIVRDISERKKAEEERKHLLESERAARAEAERTNDLKDQFLANLSHELRTPLSAIVGWSHVLRLRATDDADLRQGLEAIERNARVQTQLIEDLLDINRITSGKVRLDIQPVEPVTVIEAAIETVRPAAMAKGIRLEKLLDPAAGPISGDPSRLQQIIWNLLSNAIKFTAKDGKVQILLQRVNSHIEISVADTGIGIKPEFLDHVFERFRQADASTTRKHGGLGLGLSIVKHLVELHGGTVQVKSAGEGQGSTFTLNLPLTVVHRPVDRSERWHPKASQMMSLNFKTVDLSGVKVLVVDDETDARELVKRVLSDCNAQVWTAGSADEALTLVENQKPQVLISDIGMPEMDGYELLKRVRALGHDKGGKIPAIALTAFARTEDRTRALRAGFLIHVAKPVEPAELIATVASVTGRTDAGELE